VGVSALIYHETVTESVVSCASGGTEAVGGPVAYRQAGVDVRKQ